MPETDAPGTAKHTPGPWGWSHRRDDGDGMYRTQVYDAAEQTVATVAWTTNNKPSDGVISTNREANARLIAAAPDLLDALLAAEEFIESVDASSYTLAAVRAAIARATGSQP